MYRSLLSLLLLGCAAEYDPPQGEVIGYLTEDPLPLLELEKECTDVEEVVGFTSKRLLSYALCDDVCTVSSPAVELTIGPDDQLRYTCAEGSTLLLRYVPVSLTPPANTTAF